MPASPCLVPCPACGAHVKVGCDVDASPCPFCRTTLGVAMASCHVPSRVAVVKRLLATSALGLGLVACEAAGGPVYGIPAPPMDVYGAPPTDTSDATDTDLGSEADLGPTADADGPGE